MPFPNGIRPASHAGSWYYDDPSDLSAELDSYLAKIPLQIDGKLRPILSARAVIAPHAGYTYSGPCAAWSYAALDLSNVTRVFVLGPSHTYYLEGIAQSIAKEYATPFGNLTVDTTSLANFGTAVKKVGVTVAKMPGRNEVSEHSLEMHMPYLYKRCQTTFADVSAFPQIVPILIGDLSTEEERSVGGVLAEQLRDPHTALIVSSDFCHWGSHFRYRVYAPDGSLGSLMEIDSTFKSKEGEPDIHETIEMVDRAAIEAAEKGLEEFKKVLEETKNTVCGRHPIAVAVAAGEVLGKRFKFIRYERSALVKVVAESSVSYAAAYAEL